MVSIYPDKIQGNETFFDDLKLLKLKEIPLRKIDNNYLLSVPLERHNEYSNLLKENKIKILYVEFDIDYSLTLPTYLDDLFNIAHIYQTRKILIPLPQVKYFSSEKEDFLELINNIIVQSKNNKVEIVFKVNYEIESSVFAYLMKKNKNIMFYFNPGDCFKNNRSITSYYRLLKHNLEIVSLFDLNETFIPVLLGYGKAQILDTIDKLSRDKFKGFLIYDYNLKDYVAKREKTYKKFFKNPFGRKKRKAHLEMDQALKLSSSDSLSIVQLMETQLTLIKRYQKL